MGVPITKRPIAFIQLILNIPKNLQNSTPRVRFYHTVPIDTAEVTSELLQRQKLRVLRPVNHQILLSNLGIRCFFKSKNSNTEQITVLTNYNAAELETMFLDLIDKRNDKEIIKLVNCCIQENKTFSEYLLKELLKFYSNIGRTDVVKRIQYHCDLLDHDMYLRNGEFLHYMAKAQCLKGNSEKGLSILNNCYERYHSLRSLYRIMYKELIHDSVLNRSEASMVVFKKNVLELSHKWADHYPLICLWHICWTSSWFSDQMLSSELWETSEMLRNIVKEKATTFSVSTLKNDFNEDAVVRLLQLLLKDNMMDEYAKVLQVLFNYKLRYRDVRGCTEILRNCAVLGLTLPVVQQGRYIRLLIDGKHPSLITTKTEKFKFKF